MRRALMVLLVACSGTPSSSTTATAPAVGQPVGLPVGAPLITPGERMSYRVVLQGVELAAMNFGVGEVADLAGKPAIVVQGHAQSVGLANLVASINDTFTSWIDVETGRPLRWQSDEYETNSKTNVEHTIADLAARDGDVVPITFAINDAPPIPEPQTMNHPETWDYNAFLIALRGWEGPPGTTTTVEVLRSRWLWRVEMKIRGADKVATELGELPTIRFDGHTYKLDRKGERVADSDARDFSVWISDDDGRVPLQLVARTDYGDVKMQIVDYQPGNGTRLRSE